MPPLFRAYSSRCSSGILESMTAVIDPTVASRSREESSRVSPPETHAPYTAVAHSGERNDPSIPRTPRTSISAVSTP